MGYHVLDAGIVRVASVCNQMIPGYYREVSQGLATTSASVRSQFEVIAA
jgi:hypothetical protein